MPEYQRQTVEAKKARSWGGLFALGGLAFVAASYIGLISTSSDEYSACDIPKPAAACASVQEKDAAWLQLLETSGGVALAGTISYLGANALDRRLLVTRYARRVDQEVLNSPTSDVKSYMVGMPAAPPDIVPPKDS